MAVHPIEYRYVMPEMRAIWDEKSKWDKCLQVEAALAQAHAKVGNIPRKDALKISRKASTKYVKIDRIKKLEITLGHDIMAMIRALSEKCGGSGKYVHIGATSNDITDTCLALQFKESLPILERDLIDLKKVLISLARKTKKLVCAGRTHGQQAAPTTYGLRFAVWICEVQRHLDRLEELKPRLLVGQMTGAVGTAAAFGPKAAEVQKLTMKKLGLKSVLVSNQVIQRDRHSEFLLLMALVAETLNKIGVNIRSWQRSEIAEVEEYFDAKRQVGSSTMPSKRNPIKFERVCGLSRVISSNAFAMMKNIPMWDERDLTNSSVERVLIPESTILLDYILDLTVKSLKKLRFNRKNIERNLELSKGLIMSERVMIALTEKGMGRQDAHELLRRISMSCYRSGGHLADALKKNRKILKYFTEKEIDGLMDPHTYIGTAVKQVNVVLRKMAC